MVNCKSTSSFKSSARNKKRFIQLSKEQPWVEGAVRGEIFEQTVHWVNDGYVLCEEAANCPYCLNDRPKKRCFINFIRCECGQMEPMIIELPYMAAENLVDCIGDCVSDPLVRISRSGSGTDTRYTPEVKRTLTKDESLKLEELPLYDLNTLVRAKYGKSDENTGGGI